ncbi:hypothetical protein H310_12730 [Aphanomyces invadans]|uniref:Uncharacterized protein n=1 Tax=Aphanomyces invadans TaxID=157072 RepID=A0A024TIX9_9STRA|nr:hypothetical protein H310_12730 [Aphanomyces invadans]ETV93302.1 hypothetical protein H310_12730 [Aphanomyces invadans]|eukprot:XP_008878137.1 hypothetical protein H310_12730 [Aphanomyces invadans]
MMFDLKFGIQGEDLPIKLAFDNIVFDNYFKTALDPKQRLTVDEAFGSRSVSPAQVEQLCAEYDDVGDALAALTNL